MPNYILNRLGQSAVVLVLVSLIGFMVLNLAPGGPMSQFALNPGMSQAESATMIDLLKRLKGHYTILLVEHDMQAVFSLADRISVLVYGRAIACDTPSGIQRDEDVRRAYLGDE